MERILLDVSFWEIDFIDFTKLTPQNYIHFWRLINTEQYQFSEEHVNIASALANIFVGQELFPLFEEFLREIDCEKLTLLKKDEQFLRALVKLKMHENSFSEVYSLLQEGRFTDPENLIEVWDEAHYREKSLGLGQPLTPLEKFRIRKRNPPLPSICPKGRPVKSIPGNSREILMKWYKTHMDDPYPSKLKKQKLAAKSGLTLRQVKTWFSNARRTRRRKQQAQKTGNTPKPYRKSKFVPKKTKEWKLNKSSVAKNSASQHSCSTTQKEQVPKGKSHGKSHGVGQDKGVQLENQLYLEIFDCSKVKKDDVRTKTEVESNDLCVNETKDIPAVKITNKSNEKSDFPVNDNMDTDVLKETVKTNLKTDMIKLAELERDEKNKMAGSKENERKPMEPRHEKTNVLVPTRSDTNQAVQLQKMARGLKFWI